jgi:methionyl-tRNA formyltransferase
MKLDEGMDTGPIVTREEIPILDDDDQISLANMLSVVGASLLLETLDQLAAQGSVSLTPQDDSQATHAPPIEKEEGRIDWSHSNDQIICRIRALVPWPCAFTTHRGEEWKILKADPFTTPEGSPILPGPKVEPGTIVAAVRNKGFAVCTGTGAILVTKVQVPGKKPMDADDVVNGRLLKEGDILGR